MEGGHSGFRIICLVVAYLLTSAPFMISAQVKDSKYNIRYLTAEEGLSHNEVAAIVQDHDCFIWIGTNGGGVWVFSPKLEFHSVGYHSQPFMGLVNTRIMSVIEDSNGACQYCRNHTGRFSMVQAGSFPEQDQTRNPGNR